MAAFDFTQFSELLRTSPQQAFEYRLRVSGIEIPETYGDIKLNTSNNTAVEATGSSNATSYDIADLRKLLKDADITFSNASTIEKILEKCVENNLI